MFYRVTQSQMSITARNYLAKQTSELFTTQQQISSGVRIQRPADDPAGMRRSLIQKDRIERLEAHEAAVATTKSRVSQAHVQLRDANDLLTKAREIALQSPQITDDSERQVLAQELDGLMNQMRSIANSSDETGYLFSGTAATTMPFGWDSADCRTACTSPMVTSGQSAGRMSHASASVAEMASCTLLLMPFSGYGFTIVVTPG